MGKDQVPLHEYFGQAPIPLVTQKSMTEQRIKCAVRGLTPDGLGIALTADKQRLHVVGAIPGEHTEVVLHGHVDKVPYGLADSFARMHPERKDAFCTDFARCMRCPLMPYPDTVQRALRVRTAERFFTKLGEQSGLTFPELTWTHLDRPERWAKRIRYQYHVRKGGQVNAGLYRPDQVTLENLDDCAIAQAPLGSLLPELRDALGMYSLHGTGQIVIAIDDDPKEEKAVICIRAEDGHFPDKDWFRALTKRAWPVKGILILDREYRERYRWGKASYVPMADAKIGRKKIKSTVGVPIEDGPDVLRATHQVLEKWLDDISPDTRVLELFAGVGIFTSLLQKHTSFVDAVTTPAWAIDDLHSNFENIEKEKVRRTYASMARGLAKPYRKPDLYDLVCAWAPMRGAIGLWPTLKETQAPHLITSHADLLKSSPDLKRILKVGYRPVAVHAIESEPNRMRCTLIIRWERL